MFRLDRFGIAIALTVVVLLASLYAHAATVPTTTVQDCTEWQTGGGQPTVCTEWTHEEQSVDEMAVLPWAGALVFLGGALIWASAPRAAPEARSD